MGTFKDATENFSVALEKFRVLRAWASVSFGRVVFVMALLGVALLGVQYAYINHLLSEARKAGKDRTREITALGKEHGYKVVLDAITACLETAKDKPSLNVWYCEQAVIQYKIASENWPQERVKEVVDKQAYVAMKNDVSHYLRSVELNRLINSTVSKEEEVLKLLLSKTATALWVFFVLAVIIGAYLFLWVLPKFKQGDNDA